MDRRQRHEVGVGDRGQIERPRASTRLPPGVDVAQVDDVDPALHAGLLRRPVTLDHDEPPVGRAGRRPRRRRCRVDPVHPVPARELARVDVVLEHQPAGRSRRRRGRPPWHLPAIGYRYRPSMPMPSRPRLLGCDGRRPSRQVRVVRRHQVAGQRDRRLEQAALGVEVEDPRAELVADPQVTVAIDLQRLGVDVAAGEPPLGRGLVDDREADQPIGIAELDEVRRVGLTSPDAARERS